MSFPPPSPESIAALRRLRDQAMARGDETLGLLLAGVDLYVSAGREYELLKAMRDFASEMQRLAEHTPSAEDLRRLYEMGGTEPEGGGKTK